MITDSIIPIWLMTIICIILIILIRNKDVKVFVRRLIIVILLFVINLKIMIPKDDAKVMATNLDILFVIDNTLSMLAEDYDGKTPRLEAVKNDCKYIVDELSGANYAIITFGDDSKILTPMTKDSDMTISAINTIQVIDAGYAKGSSMNSAISNIEETLKKASEKEERASIVFYISDGEITSDEELESFSGAKKYISNGAVLGYGTKSGGKMKVSYYGEKKYLEDTTSDKYPYPDAISKIDEDNLKEIADDMGIDYINMEKQSNIKNKLREIKQGAMSNLDDTQKTMYNDIYYIFVVPLICLLIWEFIYYKRKL